MAEVEVMEVGLEDELVSSAAENNTISLPTNQHQIQVTIRKDIWTKPYLLCEFQDDQLNFDGDSGAIGRITVTDDKMEIDLKGRQFSGRLVPGPVVLMLNIAPPVGQAQSSVVGRVEAVSSEFCILDFQRDMISDLQGVFSGDLTTAGQFDDGTEDVRKKSSKKTKKGKDDDGEDSDSEGSDGSAAPLEKTNSVRKENPKISTITNRKRMKTVKKGSTAKKSAKKKITKKSAK